MTILVELRTDVHVEIAEAAAEGDLLLRGEALSAEYDHFVLVQRSGRRLVAGVIEAGGQVDVEDFGADRRRRFLDAHSDSSGTRCRMREGDVSRE